MNTPKYPSATPSLMVQGCTPDAGKTILVAARCRVLARRGVRVAPFKPQNMALNSAVTIDGGEIGRAQALQALAAGVPAHIDFNPILLKPATDRRAQVIIHGQALSDLNARDYHEYKPSGRFDPNERRERDLKRLADAVEQGLDLEKLSAWLPLAARHQIPEEEK